MSITLRSVVSTLLLAALSCAGCVEYKPVPQAKGPPASGGANTLSLAAPDSKDTKTTKSEEKADPAYECQVPSTKLMTSFKDTVPIVFVSRGANRAEWEKLPTFWNEMTEKARDPNTGGEVDRKVVKIKVPLGLTQPPPVPLESPITLDKWKLGKQLYYDKIISSDNTVACATCHDPAKGFTDQAPVSTGIAGQMGGLSAPTVLNAAYNTFQFWDGRAQSLEDQSQDSPQKLHEMYNGAGHAWNRCVKRLRANPDYVEAFKKAFGTEPTRDAVAKAIASYERTVLSGNSTADRAELAKLTRLEKEGKPASSPVESVDVEQVLKDDLAKKNFQSLKDLGLDPDKDAAKIPEVAKSIAAGRAMFIGKARCNTCHAGDNFSDSQFHNLGVGVNANGDIPPSLHGRYGAQPTGHKNPELLGAFKTPTIRGLLSTAPYLHDGSEKTLEAVIDFYDKGGNPNEFLDVNLRDLPAEKFYLTNPLGKFKEQYGAKYPEVKLFNDKPIIPLKLELTPQEKKDLILYLKALQGEPVEAIVADPAKLPGIQTTAIKSS